ncbi:2OG-Fe(II) oxygenase [Emticicia sp. BO119]|uniref:2OG-Fe(II) oxygenase n=1 Tax=Emticicia sp. BO119 TaxID=2757768 RepID=UPI0015F09702|nr:2OG-Fe(II) oxygenase [Emticicia sp. BO119]MBA4849810.1 2OG-Fe(II) oxygenase [Emticicia sp. BO119]
MEETWQVSFESIISQIVERGYGILDGFLSEDEIGKLNESLVSHYQAHEFKQAGISKDHEVMKNIRGDEILWLERGDANEAETKFLERLEYFMSYVNYTCYLGLRSYEIHYASYPVGTFYKRHLDKFRNDSGRKLSFICYLNQGWQAVNGGELVLYLPDKEETVLPLGGRLIVFESDKIEHEVLPANRERRSLTGWLRNID